MAFDPISAALELGGKLADHFFPNKAEADAAKQKLAEMEQTGELAHLAADTQLALAQDEINKLEAGSDSFWKSGWRPGIGWTCGAAFAINYAVAPVVIAFQTGHFPVMDMQTIMPVLLGMLGLGAYRTYEKTRNGNGH